MPSKPYDYNSVFKNLGISDDKEKFLLKTIHLKFLIFYEKARQQPISSFIRAVEVKCRKLAPVFSEFFNIYYEPMSESKARSGACFLFEENFFERFRISLPVGAEEEKVRNIVAHEIGHLYCAIHFLELSYNAIDYKEKVEECRNFLFKYLNSEGGQKYETYDKRADAVGVFILSERANFYKHKVPPNQKFLCKEPHQIANDLKKRK